MNGNVKCRPRSRGSIRHITNELRDVLKVDLEKPFPLMEFLEGVLPEIGVTIDIVSDNNMGYTYAEAVPDRKIILIRDSTYIGATNRNPNPRDRFTIAHEIGHIFLHNSKNLSFTRAETIKKYEDSEWQANTFAGELLVPTEHIKIEPSLTVAEIAQRYKVSYKVAEIQSNAQYI